MIELLRAEWQKMVGNRWTTGFLIWIFPVGALGFVVIMTVLALASATFRDNINPYSWTDAFMVPWSFANNLFGRSFLLGFTAVTFAGEYQWGTWKMIVPRRRRSYLILAKFTNLVVLILLAFGLMSLIFGVGYGILSWAAGQPYGPEVSRVVLAEFLADYTLQAVLAFISVLIAAIYAALAAMKMQSILGGIMVGVAISVFEPLIFPAVASLVYLFDNAAFLHLARFSPFYNIENVNSWARNNQPFFWLDDIFGYFNLPPPADSLSFSVLVLACWLLAGTALVLFLFQRQDISM